MSVGREIFDYLRHEDDEWVPEDEGFSEGSEPDLQ